MRSFLGRRGLPAAKDALVELEPEATMPTRGFSGRLGRVGATDYVKALASPEAPAPYPFNAV